MGIGKELNDAQLKKRLGKETAQACIELMAAGWSIRAQGHGARAYCPCNNRPGHQFPISSTPGSGDSAQAKRVRREANRCATYGKRPSS